MGGAFAYPRSVKSGFPTERSVAANGSVHYDTTKASPPLSFLGGPDGSGQMSHFVKDDKMNIFRLPVGWKYLTASNVGGTLNPANLQKYDQLVQACLKSSANTVCVIDIHNYARWNKQIIGQGGPSNAQFVNLWTQLATKYKGSEKVAFGLMNEPHEVDILNEYHFQRNNSDIIEIELTVFLPGNDYTSAGRFISNGSGAALSAVKNPDGTFKNLIFDVHKYLDSDNSGTHTECVTDNINEAFQPLATWLRSNSRQAILSETGGGNTASCTNANSDVYLGYIEWAAGSFSGTYELNEVPTGNGNNWQDTSLVKACLER
ncbi:hypothetical protein HYALB_00009252 [Hymenoscyphus albidus]|uniref:cellulase n=1 Tax=Hymenoscyphus albidus TaxID=595503 RepID=A0A9N9LUC5_9HELO|nr:hypothetical protein HYALB_00009252 [Hymenoscyphus albidus]